MALLPPLDPRPPSEPLNHPPGAPRELNLVGCAICPASGEERIRQEQAQKQGQDSLDPLEHFQGGLRGNEPATGPPRLPAPSASEDPAGGKHHECPISARDILEVDQGDLHLCLLGLGLQLQDLERGLGPWASAQSGMVQLQALQADLRGAAERVDALLVFGEGLAQQSEPQTRASLEQILRVLGAHRDSIFRRLWRLQAQLVSYSLVFQEANILDQDLEVEGDSDGPGPGGVWGPRAPSSLPTPAELEWDPAGDVGGLGPLGRKTPLTPGAPCELCGHRGSQGRGQGLESLLLVSLALPLSSSLLKISLFRQNLISVTLPILAPPQLCVPLSLVLQGSHTALSPQDMLLSGLSHRKHLAGHRRRSLLRKSQDKKRQASPHLQDVMLEVDPGAPAPVSRRPLTFLLLLFLFLLLVGATVLLPLSGDPCSSPARLARTPYVVLSYVNGPPPV
ncbi:nesprin-4 [Equus przewalskii]|uniref:Nesprin-4 n=1 Tax=Equus przewalskii TaxID=9798 RepID=A0ABM4JI53_EQUPR